MLGKCRERKRGKESIWSETSHTTQCNRIIIIIMMKMIGNTTITFISLVDFKCSGSSNNNKQCIIKEGKRTSHFRECITESFNSFQFVSIHLSVRHSVSQSVS